MVIDVRARMICNLGELISGQLGDDPISDSGIIRTTGSLELDGITRPARGSDVHLAYERPQVGAITRFPRRLRVLRSTANPTKGTTTVDVGCVLALRESLNGENDSYLATSHPPAWWNASLEVPPVIESQAVLLHCLEKIGVTLASGSVPLTFCFLRSSFDLSGGYVETIGKLLISHCCYGRLDMNEQLVVQRLDMNSPGSGPVLRMTDLIELEPVAGGVDPADKVTVKYNAVRRP